MDTGFKIVVTAIAIALSAYIVQPETIGGWIGFVLLALVLRGVVVWAALIFAIVCLGPLYRRQPKVRDFEPTAIDPMVADSTVPLDR